MSMNWLNTSITAVGAICILAIAAMEFVCVEDPKTGQPKDEQPLRCRLMAILSSTACSTLCLLLLVSMVRGLLLR